MRALSLRAAGDTQDVHVRTEHHHRPGPFPLSNPDHEGAGPTSKVKKESSSGERNRSRLRPRGMKSRRASLTARPRHRRRRVVAVHCAVFLIAGTGTGVANPFGPNDPDGCAYADNSFHTFTYVNLTPEFNSSMNWARVDALGNPTDMTQAYVGRDSATDVVAFDDNYAGTFLGYILCVDDGDGCLDVSIVECSQWEVFLDVGAFAGRHQDERTKTAVHEVGHSVGHGHSDSTSPMETGYSRQILFTPHQVGHINNRY